MNHRVKQMLFGSSDSIAETVYGTIVVMATVTAGSSGEQTDAWRLAILVGVTAAVLWIAHVYSRGLAESLELGRRLGRAEIGGLARSELPIAAPAVVPVAVLVLAAFGVLEEQTAVWLALGFGVTTLGVQGARYATVKQLDRTRTFAVIALNMCLGLVLVALKVLVTH